MLKAILIDNDYRDREILELLLRKYCVEEVFIAGNAETVTKAYQLVLETKPDLIFLDVELGMETGFDLLSKFTDFSFKVIFVTAYDRYALQAIKFNALDYLLKPIEITELVRAVQKTMKTNTVSIDAELKNLIHTLSHPHHKNNRVAIPMVNGYKMIAVEEIQYCEAQKEYTYIHCTKEPVICSSLNLGEYEELLQGYAFFRVHHSYLVNKDHVKQYIKTDGGELVVGNNILIPVSRRKKQEVLDWLIDV
jgi:two-component system, LytTR family, response regulator